MASKRTIIKIQYDSPVILTFSLLCLLSMFVNYLTNNAAQGLLFSVYRSSFTDPLTYVRLFTHVLGHADIGHFLGNICLVLVLGPVVESRYSSKRLFWAIVVTALVTGLVHIAIFSKVALLGASGIVFMLIFLSSVSGIRGGNIPVSLILVAVIYLGQEVLDMFLSDNISQLTHIVGGLCGIVMGFRMAKKRR